LSMCQVKLDQEIGIVFDYIVFNISTSIKKFKNCKNRL